jgi:hypothetical protein
LFLSNFDVADQLAQFDWTANVVSSSKQGAIIGKCGVGSKMSMSRKSGAWEVVNNAVSVCTVH